MVREKERGELSKREFASDGCKQRGKRNLVLPQVQ